ncbi:MAG TPA: ferritin [Candidatus Moranbacteria bacterium]|nr:ferritin [Candidatus Moranbacteria bacterium]HAT75014.1 ferritin [Candidatus Moranbacteria bacterium]
MKTFICEICGDAYIGHEKPADCPFCGAKGNFIKFGSEANPIANQENKISELSQKNLEETLQLEMRANAIYLCMAEKAESYEIKAMYKRLAKIEWEHANIACKLMKIKMPEIIPQFCDDNDIENFKTTIELEDHAVELYKKFTREATEKNIKIFFTALAQAEEGHSGLIKNYL